MNRTYDSNKTPFENFESQQAGEKPGQQELDLRSQEEIDEAERLNPPYWKDAEGVADADMSFETFGEPAPEQEDDLGGIVEDRERKPESVTDAVYRSEDEMYKAEELLKELQQKNPESKDDSVPQQESMRKHIWTGTIEDKPHKHDKYGGNHKTEKQKMARRAAKNVAAPDPGYEPKVKPLTKIKEFLFGKDEAA